MRYYNRLSLVIGSLSAIFGAACSAAPGTSGAGGSPAAGTGVVPASAQVDVEAGWRRSVTKSAMPEDGCFEIKQPSTTWVKVPCTTPPNLPLMPAHGAHGETVGNGNDMVAQTSGTIHWAEGSFPEVSGVTTETDNKTKTANSYTLQLNSQPFSGAGPCSGAKTPSACQGWEQFVYNPGFAFIQYWLLNYNNTCPSGWNTSGANCWKNSSSGSSVPSEPVTSLASMTLTGVAGSADSVIVSVGNGTLYSYSQASVLNLNTAWQSAEFNVLGYGDSSEANFNTGSTIVVQTLTDVAATTNAATCASTGFTAETNNLTIPSGSCGAFGGDLPGILFTESNASSPTAYAHPVNAELGFEQIKGDFNGDGVEDVIIVNASGSYEYLGSRSGGFTGAAWTRTDLPLGAVSYVPGDFNGDGATDLIVITAGGSYEYTGYTGGGFTTNVWTRTDLPLGAVSYVPGDFNGDGKTDLILVTAGGSYEYTGLAAGGFTGNVWTRTDLPLGAVNYVPGDFNGDGATDLIVITAGGSYEYTGYTGGGFTTNVWTRSNLPLGKVNYASGDFNGDGKTDLIVITAGGSYEYTGLAAGGFTANVWTRTDLPLGAVSYVPGDFNGDGAMDLIVITAGGSYEYTGYTGGGFTTNVWTRTDLVAAEVVYEARDFNGDGKTDLIIQTPTGSYEYTGLAAGGFTGGVWSRTDLPARTTTYF